MINYIKLITVDFLLKTLSSISQNWNNVLKPKLVRLRLLKLFFAAECIFSHWLKIRNFKFSLLDMSV